MVTRTLVVTALLAASLALPAAQAASPVKRSDTVNLDLSELISMDQLKHLLEQQGYTDILLSPVKPNSTNPRPDIQDSGPKAVKSVNPATTPIHEGWNGTAVKDGKRVNIEIDSHSRMRLFVH